VERRDQEDRGGGGGGGGGGPSGLYVLVDRKAVPCPHTACWGEWYENADRCVGRSTVGRFTVCTSFLGIDFSFGDGPPILFETMTFVEWNTPKARATGLPRHGASCRCSTWSEAEIQHARHVAIVHEMTYPERYGAVPLETSKERS
jgi:hypothetical protein